ncbi:MAG: hypothetical protein JOZ69_25090 [Myxococcales bacterium]|nr:hypothetical protein [Myxococcales bacterium]
MSVLRFEIRYADGRKEIATVDGERALIGHGGHCDVRLPLDQAANEHVAVEVVGGTVRVETKAFDPPATINGLAFTKMPIPPDVPLKLATTRIFISLVGDVTLEGGTPAAQKKGEQTSPAMKLLGVLVLAGVGYMLLPGDEAKVVQAPAQAPELFDPSPTTCPQTAPDQARASANDKRDIADGKRERSPFVAKDGVQAVALYDLAAVCYRQAGEPALAAQMQAASAQLRESIVQDFRARRVRLEHLMAVQDYELAKKDVGVLRSLTEGKQGPWVNWLARADRIVKRGNANE